MAEDAKVLATPLTYAGYPYAGLGYAGAYGYAGYPYTVAAPAKVEVETVKAPAVLPAVRSPMPPLLLLLVAACVTEDAKSWPPP